jgi:hypothetical protein
VVHNKRKGKAAKLVDVHRFEICLVDFSPEVIGTALKLTEKVSAVNNDTCGGGFEVEQHLIFKFVQLLMEHFLEVLVV